MWSESKDGVDCPQADESYEFCAPRFFDFMNEENEDEIRTAELWLQISQSYAPFKKPDDTTTAADKARDAQDLIVAAEAGGAQRHEMNNGKILLKLSLVKPSVTLKQKKSSSMEISSSSVPVLNNNISSFAFPILPSFNILAASEVLYPPVQLAHRKSLSLLPAMIADIHHGLRQVIGTFTQKGSKPSAQIQTVKVELPYTYLIAWFVLHRSDMMFASSAADQSVPPL
ncbi:uncharacterized protein A4U43_C03F11460 [Asparagus officinalis]|uniref:Protein TPX2 n=1 Tax=Asparagus officinalis TaxID=4686 RepID=A0A5P1FDG5_ASPOF|nr:uncharacterized protein A4U43_C03F11460 [Asparagus officinalis]